MTVRGAVSAVSSWLRVDPIRAYLAAMGAFHIAIGLTWILTSSRSRELGIDWIPGVTAPLVGVVWIITGTIAIGSALGVARRIGFIALIVWPTALGAFFLVSWAIAQIPDAIFHGGNPNGIVTTISYWGYATAHALVSRIWMHVERLDRAAETPAPERIDA